MMLYFMSTSEACMRCAEGLIAYVEWAPLTRVRASGLIGACAYLLSVPEHRMAAATVLRELSTRKQLQVRQQNMLTRLAIFLV